MKKFLVVMLSVVAITGLLVVPSFGADKLIVKDSSGTNNKFVVDDAGKVTVNSDQAHAQLLLSAASSTVNKPMIVFQRAKGTQASPTAVQTGDSLGQFLMSGATGAATFDATRRIFEILATENWSSTNGGYKFSFYTRPNGSMGAPQEVVSMTETRRLQMFGGAYSDGTSWVNASSREYKDNIEALSADKAVDTLKNLTPVTYTYKTMPEQNHVGFIAEDVPDLVAMKDRKGLSPMDIVAVLTKVVQEQTKTIEALSAKVDKLENSAK